jgi:SAM-dependent methyltransferase
MSTGTNWKEIWSKRGRVNGGDLDLKTLIELDGFDSGAGRIDAMDWQAYADVISKKLGVRDGATVFEVGCGAGAFLYALRQRHSLIVGGLDYSEGLISAAKVAMPDGDFLATEAKLLNPEITYDFVIANGVFHYFSCEYAAEVLARMLKKARIAVAILEIPDFQTRAESETIRRSMLSQDEYDKKYAGLEHTYYRRDWFNKQASAVSDFSCETFDGCIPNYVQNNFRFGVVLKKPECR